MPKVVTQYTQVSTPFQVQMPLPIDDRMAVSSYMDLFQKSTWLVGSAVTIYKGMIAAVSPSGNTAADAENVSLWFLTSASGGGYKYLYDPEATSLVYPKDANGNDITTASSATEVAVPGKANDRGWRKISLGDSFKLPDDPGDYILVIDQNGDPQWTDKRLVPSPDDLLHDAGMVLTVQDNGSGELTYGWESFWLPKPSVEGDYVLRRDSNGNFTWVLSSSGSAEDTIGINIEGIYEDDGTGSIQPKSGASTTRKETLANTGAVVAVEEGQAADGKFRLEIPIIDGGDAWGDTGTIPSPTPTPAFNPAAVTIMIDGTAIETLGTSDNVIPASMSGIYIPTPYVPAGSAIRYSTNFNIIPGSTTQIDTGNDVSSTCQVMIWAGGTWIDCFECEQDLLTGVWDVEQKDSGTDVIAPDLACIILS